MSNNKLSRVLELVRNMGWRYIIFRSAYELQKRSGWLRRKFPVNPRFQNFLSLPQWKQEQKPFFFQSRETLNFPRNPSQELKEEFEKIKKGDLKFFNSITFSLGNNYDWVTHPETNFHYDINLHWTQINDFSEDAGDIKFVWEKSRFSYLYTVIRYDYHFGEDCAEWVFQEIMNWINANPVNCGPNYHCSQEISLRVLNWIFALYYYQRSPHLTEEVFNKLQFSIYWQMHHVYHNINFSRIAVRNNHALTETLALYLVGLLLPQFPNAKKWKSQGKKWFEKEIAYQVYDDGTFLQFSMNYHRVVIQLFTWAIRLADINGERFDNVVYERAGKSLYFLISCQDKKSGWLPNYGANDGALFFKLNDANYRDYTPQLQALASALGKSYNTNTVLAEDIFWLGLNDKSIPAGIISKNKIRVFDKGGYYIFKEDNFLTFIRCGKHKDRPSQADNLHLDIWHDGINFFRDAGSYKYNAAAAEMNYFMGTRSHNTVMLNSFNQMQKGPRFIWYQWSQAKEVMAKEENDCWIFEGKVSCFRQANKNLEHYRKVIKYKKKARWEITDQLNIQTAFSMLQLWHPHPDFINKIKIEAADENGNNIKPLITDGWYAGLYGCKEKVPEIVFETNGKYIKTTIEIENT